MRARALQQEERRLAERRVQIARRVQQAEVRLAEVEERARTAAAAANYARQQVAQRAIALAPLVPVMRRLSLWPAESLLAIPTSAEEAVRGLQLLQALSRKLAEDILALRRAEQDAERQGALAAQQAEELAAARAAANRLSTQLEEELAEARLLQGSANSQETEAARRAQEAASRAGTIEAALAQLERERQAQVRRQAQEALTRRVDAPPPIPAPKGGRVMPVAGTVTRDFNAPGEGGPARGATFQAPAGARVVSPCGGRVSFAGPFRSFGNLVIVDCGDAYHFVLAGLDRMDVGAGQRVLAGEPIGTLGGATEARRHANLYLELRHRGAPVDPRQWLAGRS
jgi:septal ring factor EnvC (AmiA/AmiB activator)